METQIFPSNAQTDKLKAYWDRPGGKFGVLFGIGVLVSIAYYVIPILTVIVWSTFNFAVALTCLAAFLYCITNRKLRLSLFYFYEILMKKLVGIVIELDPFIIAEDYINDMEKQREKLYNQSVEVQGQKEKIDMKIKEKEDEKAHLFSKAKVAKEKENRVLTSRQKSDSERYELNKELRRQQCKEYYKKNREKIKQQRAQFHIENSENRKEQQKKRRENPDFRMESTLRRRARRCFIYGPRSKEILGCTIHFLKLWFKYLFTKIDPYMTLENHGSYWEIDHVKPVSSFDLKNDDDVKVCFNWRNISPLEKSMNRAKSKNILEEVIQEHNQRVDDFIELCKNNNISEDLNETIDTAGLL